MFFSSINLLFFTLSFCGVDRILGDESDNDLFDDVRRWCHACAGNTA